MGHLREAHPGCMDNVSDACVCVWLYTFVARAANAHQLVIHSVTAVGKVASTARPVGAHAGATVAS